MPLAAVQSARNDQSKMATAPIKVEMLRDTIGALFDAWKGGLKSRVIVPRRATASGHLFLQHRLAAFEGFDLAFVCGHDGGRFRFDKAVKELRNLILDRADLDPHLRCLLFARLRAFVPKVAENLIGEAKQFR